MPTVTSEMFRHWLLKTEPEAFSFDLDGNLTSDGRWTYTWDAENRLIAMQSAISNQPSKILFT